MSVPIKRVNLIILDSVGCGDAPDAAAYGDGGSNTLANTARAVGGLNLPHLGAFGLGNLTDIQGVPPVAQARGAYGRLTETSAGKDTTTGHWEYTGMLMANLVDFDALYGHRNNPRGYADALEAFDRDLPRLEAAMRPDEITLLTADHGNDPTTPSTDHPRERTPLLAFGAAVKANVNLGTRATFADTAATIADLLGLTWSGAGQSFAGELLN